MPQMMGSSAALAGLGRHPIRVAARDGRRWLRVQPSRVWRENDGRKQRVADDRSGAGQSSTLSPPPRELQQLAEIVIWGVARTLFVTVLLNALHFFPRLGLGPSQGLLKVAFI